MRANEFITETINPDILNPKFRHQQQIGDYILTAKSEQTKSGRVIFTIKCYHSGIVRTAFMAGQVYFYIHSKNNQQWLESGNTSVYKDFRGQNIASMMYAYAKMLGNDVKPSTVKLPPGKKMWKAWEKSGAAAQLANEIK